VVVVRPDTPRVVAVIIPLAFEFAAVMFATAILGVPVNDCAVLAVPVTFPTNPPVAVIIPETLIL
jgi:hypothetical protein